MSSGNKRVIYNGFERATSGDQNSEQAYAARSEGQSRRYLHNARYPAGSSVQSGGATAPSTLAVDSGVAHDCYSGLMVRCDNAAYLTVDPGVAGILQPAFAGLTADDTPYITVDSPGVVDTGTLVFSANAGPGVRWDVVECQPVDTVVATAPRDIFDPVSKSFSSQVVDKVSEAQLTFRIRAGTPGAGLAAPEEDWMPLAVIMVPAGAVGFTECDVWDVRPLVSERAQVQMRGATHSMSSSARGARIVMREIELTALAQSGYGPDSQALVGYYQTEFNGYMAGGDIRKSVGTAGTGTFGDSATATGGESDRFVPEDPQNIGASGYGGANTRPLGIVALFPSGYVRWRRYSQSSIAAGVSPDFFPSAGRWPRGPRGILTGVDLSSVTVYENGVIEGATVAPPSQMELVTGNNWGHIVGYAVRLESATDIIVPEGGTADQTFLWKGISKGTPPSTPFQALMQPSVSALTAGPAASIAAKFQADTGATSLELRRARSLIYRTGITIDPITVDNTGTWRWNFGESDAGQKKQGPHGRWTNHNTGNIFVATDTIEVPLGGGSRWDQLTNPVVYGYVSLTGDSNITFDSGSVTLVGYKL